MSFKTRDGKTHQSTVLMGENGFPVDTIATISGSYVFLEGESALSYSSGDGTVTLPAGNDLTPVTTAKARYTGKYVLITSDQELYYIDRQSIDVGNRTFVISVSDKNQVQPASIDLTKGWKVAEADIVNRVATTSAAKFDNIEFRDMQFQLQLDGDPVTVRGENGNTLEPNNDGSINVVNQPIAFPTVLNTNLTTAGTEYEVDFPASTKRFIMKTRQPATIQIYFTSGATQTLTLKPGATYSEEGLTLQSLLTIYIKSSKDNTVLETLYWE